MPEEKYCYQIDYLSKPMRCFIHAGNTPCESPGCPVDDEARSLQENHVPITLEQVRLSCHLTCRVSSMSTDNDEYLARMQALGETHLLSIIE